MNKIKVEVKPIGNKFMIVEAGNTANIYNGILFDTKEDADLIVDLNVRIEKIWTIWHLLEIRYNLDVDDKQFPIIESKANEWHA